MTVNEIKEKKKAFGLCKLSVRCRAFCREKIFNPGETEFLTEDCKAYAYQANSYSVYSDDMSDINWKKGDEKVSINRNSKSYQPSAGSGAILQ